MAETTSTTLTRNGASIAPKTPGRGLNIPGFGVVDGRRREAWAFRETVDQIAADLGGHEVLSRAQLEHARRAAGLSVLISQLEGQIVEGGDVDVDRLVTLANAQSRILSRLGLERRARDATPKTALDYAQQHAAEGAG